MKNIYYLGGDLFLAIAFVSFIIGVVSKLLGIDTVWLGITSSQIVCGGFASLLFSIALNISELTTAQRKK